MAMQAPSVSSPLEPVASAAGTVDREARFPEASLVALVDAGWLGLGVPEHFGGPGVGQRRSRTRSSRSPAPARRRRWCS